MKKYAPLQPGRYRLVTEFVLESNSHEITAEFEVA